MAFAPVRDSIRSAILADAPGASFTELGKRYRISRQSVAKILRRLAEGPRVDPHPSQAGGLTAATVRALRTHAVAGDAGVLWDLLLEAGPDGATSEAMSAAVYRLRPVPVSWVSLRNRHLRLLRLHAETHGIVLDEVEGAVPRRWRLRAREPGEKSPDLVQRAPTAVGPVRRGALARPAPPSAPSPVALVAPAEPLATLTGAAAALDRRGPQGCRWPIGHPSDHGFRFCEALRLPGKSYCRDHHREGTEPKAAPLRSAKRCP